MEGKEGEKGKAHQPDFVATLLSDSEELSPHDPRLGTPRCRNLQTKPLYRLTDKLSVNL